MRPLQQTSTALTGMMNLAAAAYIGLSTPSRWVAMNLFSIMRDLKNARTLTAVRGLHV